MQLSPRWNLASLPVEVWRNLSKKLLAEDILNLLLTGSPSLHLKLKTRTAITHLSYLGFQDEEREPSLAKGLDSLTFLSLSHCSPSTLLHVMNSLDMPRQLHQLEFLELTSPQATSIWGDGDVKWPRKVLQENGLVNLQLALPSIVHLHISHFSTLQGPYPHSLRSLRIKRSPKILELSGPLPPLTSLRLPDVFLIRKDTIKILPITVTFLESRCELDHVGEMRIRALAHKFKKSLSTEDLRSLLDSPILDLDSVGHLETQDTTGLVMPSYRELEEEEINQTIEEFHASRLEGFGLLHYLPSLKHLYVHCNQESCADCIKLPSTLESLKIELNEYKSAFGAYYPSGLTYLDDLAFGTPFMEEYLRSLPPRLTKLRARGLQCLHFPSAEFTTPLLPLLPQTITKLSLNAWPFDPKLHFPLLPPHLRTFKWTGSVLASDLRLLPQGLKKLLLSAILPDKLQDIGVGSIADTSSYPPWPPGLANVEIDRTPFTVRTLVHLQPSIKTFTFGEVTIDDYFISTLIETEIGSLIEVSAQSLSKIAIKRFRLFGPRQAFNWPIKLTEACLRGLSNFCKQLQCEHYLQGLNNYSFEDFRFLTHLSLDYVVIVDTNTPPIIPSTNSYFSANTPPRANPNITQEPFLTDHMLQHLPPTLKILQIRAIDRTYFSMRALNWAPSHLTRLELPQVWIHPAALASFWPSEEHQLTSETASTLASNMVKRSSNRFTVQSFHITPSIPEPFLQSIVDSNDELLHASFASHITIIILPSDYGMSEFYTHLPPRLKILDLHMSMAISPKAIASLPRTLVSLSLQKDRSINDDCLTNLPPSMEILRLPANSHISNAGLAMLPRVLKELVLSSADGLSDRGMVHLPSDLEVLDIASAQISGESFILLPRSLTRLDISGSDNLGDADPSFLPSSLTALDAPQKLIDRHIEKALPKLQLEACTSGNFMKLDSCSLALFDDC